MAPIRPQFVSVTCPRCAGPLRVRIDDVNVQCDFCDTETTLHEFDGGYELHLVDQITDLRSDYRKLYRDEQRIVRVQKAIRALDKRWDAAIEDLMKNTKFRHRTNGRDVSTDGLIGCNIGCAVFLALPPLYVAVIAANMYVQFAAISVALAGFVYGLFNNYHYYQLLKKRDQMELVYLARRQKLLQRLQKARHIANRS